MDVSASLYGKFPGYVVDNHDPDHVGRLRVQVDSLSKDPLTWALPCFPVAGDGVGIVGAPPRGSKVFVEFIGGDIRYPIWVGAHFAESTEVPERARRERSSTSLVLEAEGVGIEIVGGPQGSVTLYLTDGPKLTLSSSGIAIDAGRTGTVTLNGTSVDLNDGGLRVQ